MHALIVLGGDAPGKALLESCAASAEMSIAVDRGLEAFVHAGVKPDILLGDMDSVRPDLLERLQADTEVDRLPCVKDDTDGVHALDVAIERGARHITLLGALGGRMDHAMANLMLLIRAARRGVKAQILSETVRIERADSVTMLCGAKGDTVSLLPMGEAKGVTLTGFYYPLERRDLDSSYPLGISNVVTEDPASIQVESGDLMVFHHYAGC